MLPKPYRLCKNREFRYVYARGSNCGSALLSLVHISSGPPGSLRVGFSVSKKVGNAVTRNLVKRRMRAAFRELMPEVRTGCRLVFVARPACADRSYADIQRDMKKLLRKARRLRASEPAPQKAGPRS